MDNKQKSKKVGVGKAKPYVWGSLGKAIYKLLETKGLENVTYEESLKLALSTCPHTHYNKYHFAWYKGQLRKRRQLAKLAKK